MLSILKPYQAKLIEHFTDNDNYIDPYLYDVKDKFYYSSIPNFIDFNTFINKPYLWFSERIDQVITHPFDVSFTTPYLIKFKFNRDYLYLLNSKDPNNEYLFYNLFNFLTFTERDLLINKIVKHFGDDYFNETSFSNNRNYRILTVIQSINNLLEKKYYLDGYRNYYDQAEIGINNYSGLIEIDSIYKYLYIKSELNTWYFDTPNNKPLYRNQLEKILGLGSNSIKFGYETRDIIKKINNYNIPITLKRVLSPKNISIYYQNINTKEINKFDCGEDVWY